MPRVEAPPAAKPTATWFPAPGATFVAKAQARPPSRQQQHDAPGESCHDSPGEDEETQTYYTRTKGSQAAIQELLGLGVVRHDSELVGGLWKNKGDVIVKITTVGYVGLGSRWGATSFKPYSKAEAEQHKSRLYGLQQLLEESGEYNVGAHVRVDCTVLARHYDHTDIHIGENVQRLRKAIDCPAFSKVLRSFKAAWICFLRDGQQNNSFSGLLFDPYGQCRSVALARIVCHCLSVEGAQVLNVTHLSKSSWQESCCNGECTHCTNAPMSSKKAALLKSAHAIWADL